MEFSLYIRLGLLVKFQSQAGAGIEHKARYLEIRHIYLLEIHRIFAANLPDIPWKSSRYPDMGFSRVSILHTRTSNCHHYDKLLMPLTYQSVSSYKMILVLPYTLYC